ncbi:Uncharacterized protein APZ42_031935 [Daphnia magna]|uniref:Secreted protein n=1 Tax=Daphnia magna TaxID=35525 RepID=A0A164MDT6_9CRUS|nr:Uncharacterized protein APZ42_031935 [Daphnia magna]
MSFSFLFFKFCLFRSHTLSTFERLAGSLLKRRSQLGGSDSIMPSCGRDLMERGRQNRHTR